MSLPKVLIFGQVFNQNSGGGVTLSNLFKGWDKDKIAVASIGQTLNDVESNVCDSYYLLGDEEYKFIYPFNKLQRSFPSGFIKIIPGSEYSSSRPAIPKAIKSSKAISLSKIRKFIIEQIFYPLVKFLGISHTISSIGFSKDFCNWLEEFKPEVLYVQVSERVGILFAQKLQAFLKIPLIIHNMDDWPSTISQKGFFKKYWHKKITDEFKALLNQASILMSISEDMAIEYKKRYGKDFLTFHNPINIDFWKQHQRNNYTLNESPTILYAGRIGPGIEDSLKLIAEAIENVNKELGTTIKFILQTRDKLLWFKKYNNIVHRSFVLYDDLPEKFAEADILALPYDFSKHSIKFIKYSMPTKAPEYMICGTPILIFAPEVTAIVKYARKFNIAKIVTKNDASSLAEAIKILITNKAERETIAINAKKIAEANHSSEIITSRFREIISSLKKEKVVTKHQASL
jgi:glycosyltransferase involved in cell wall biosynthesis